MKHLLLSLLTMISFTAAAEVVWKPIPAYKDTTTAFIDTDSINRAHIDGREYISALFLISSNKEFAIIASGKPVKARSTVKQIMVECRSATMSVNGDYYFKEAMPVEASAPVASTEIGPRGVMLLPKSHFVYITLCATSV